MQFSVILGILLTVLNERNITRKRLAEKFEVSERTVSRYLDVIEAAGVPISSKHGKGGGIILPDSYRLDRSFFGKEELKRLSTCVNAMKGSFEDNLCNSLLDKINNMARNKDDERYLLKSDTLIIDTGTWTNPNGYRSKMETINKAIASELALDMIYIDKRDFKTERKFDPYSLVLKEGVWYVYGWCRLRRDFRLFKLNRIQHLYISTTPYVRRESDVYAKLREGFDDNELVALEFEFSSTVKAEIEEWLGMDAISERGTKYIAQADVYGGNLLINKLLGFGSSIKVLSPAPLKEELLIECKRILNAYPELR